MVIQSTSRATTRLWALLRLIAIIPVTAVLGHDAAYAVRHGIGDQFAIAMTAGNHDGYWSTLTLAVAVLGGLVLAIELARVVRLGLRVRRAGRPHPRTAPVSSYLRECRRLWPILFVASATIFVIQEELEHLGMGVSGHGFGVLFGPEHPFALPVFAAVAAVVAAIGGLIRWRVRLLEARVVKVLRAKPPRPLPVAPAPSWPVSVVGLATGSVIGRHDAGRAPPIPA